MTKINAFSPVGPSRDAHAAPRRRTWRVLHASVPPTRQEHQIRPEEVQTLCFAEISVHPISKIHEVDPGIEMGVAPSA